MDDESEFLRRIIADPADDTVRLVFADWLDERGLPGDPERAEFVRVQVELARTDPNTPTSPNHDRDRDPRCPCRYCVLTRRGEKAWDAYCRSQLTECPDWPIALWCPPDASHLTYRRGFVEAVRIRAEDWVRAGDAIRAAHPVSRVVLTTWPGLEYDPGDSWVIPAGWCDPTEWPTGVVQLMRNREKTIRRGCAARWRGVVFELPK